MLLGRLFRRLLIPFAACLLAGCLVQPHAERRLSSAEEPARILLAPDRATLYVGADGGDEERFPSSLSFVARVLNAEGKVLVGEAGGLIVTSSDEAIAKVDTSGRMTSVASGRVMLIIHAAARPSLRATASVTVLDVGHAAVVVR